MTASVAKENLKAVVKKFTRRACFVCDQVKRFVFIVLGRGDIGMEKRRDDEPQHATFHVPDHLHLEDLEAIITDSKCRRMCSSNGITPRDMRSCFHKMDPFGKGVCVTGDFFLSLVRVISDVEGIDVLSLKSSLRREVMELDELRKRFESVIRSMTLVDSELRRMPEEMINHSFEATKPEEQTISGAAEKEMFAAATAAALAGEGPAGAALTDTETLRRLQDENAWLHARLVEISKEMKVKQLAGSKSAVISLLQHEVRAHHEGESQYAAPLSPRAAAGMRSGDVLNMLEDLD